MSPGVGRHGEVDYAADRVCLHTTDVTPCRSIRTLEPGLDRLGDRSLEIPLSGEGHGKRFDTADSLFRRVFVVRLGRAQ